MTENTGHTGTAVNLDADELIGIRAAVATWTAFRDSGVGDDENLNLADYAAAVLPRLCDEIQRLTAEVDAHRAATLAIYSLIARYDAAVDGLIPGVTKNLLEGVLGHLRPLTGTRSDTDVAADYGIDLDGRRP